tara:strand:- start:28 stop:180 length:153 start_codon:yes stop_codon:yes gene_type:complete
MDEEAYEDVEFTEQEQEYTYECQACAEPIKSVKGMCDTCDHLFDKAWEKD